MAGTMSAGIFKLTSYIFTKERKEALFPRLEYKIPRMDSDELHLVICSVTAVRSWVLQGSLLGEGGYLTEYKHHEVSSNVTYALSLFLQPPYEIHPIHFAGEETETQTDQMIACCHPASKRQRQGSGPGQLDP